AGRVQGRLLRRLGVVPEDGLEDVRERVHPCPGAARVARGGVPDTGRFVLGAPELAARPSGLRRAAEPDPGGVGTPALALDRRGADAHGPLRLELPALPADLRRLLLCRHAG